eukprot:TRINITY_DN6235_c0_g1_i2.p1 TRINITY_DN6235_c0_g1~~TRINITY_DN6235_c0_g1_i2.p1  ORF type:complete len:230 (+),score=65.11 TRINITY_DN6235_c0_g1_i2:133-822(+)
MRCCGRTAAPAARHCQGCGAPAPGGGKCCGLTTGHLALPWVTRPRHCEYCGTKFDRLAPGAARDDAELRLCGGCGVAEFDLAPAPPEPQTLASYLVAENRAGVAPGLVDQVYAASPLAAARLAALSQKAREAQVVGTDRKVERQIDRATGEYAAISTRVGFNHAGLKHRSTELLQRELRKKLLPPGAPPQAFSLGRLAHELLESKVNVRAALAEIGATKNADDFWTLAP